jgi:hypothetical protein
MTRVLVVGVPRSGTTWVASMLQATADASLVLEPDNHHNLPFAVRAKRGLRGGCYPALSPADEARSYEALWLQALGCRGTGFTLIERLRRAAARRLFTSVDVQAVRKSFAAGGSAPLALRAAEALAVPERPYHLAPNLILKSVYSALAVEWIAARTQARVVIVSRDIRNVVSSWLEMGWLRPDAEEELAVSDAAAQELLRLEHAVPAAPADGSRLRRLSWFLALLTLALEDSARRHPEWQTVRHEELCVHPDEGFRVLAANLGLTWTEGAGSALAAVNRPGRGYEVTRVARDLPEAWRSRLSPEQVAEVEAGLEGFPLAAVPR